MTTVVFIHSAGSQGPGEGSSALLDGLKQALPHGMTLVAPAMPEPDNPSAERWIDALHRVLDRVEGPQILAGHSLGGSILLQTLARHGTGRGLKGVLILNSPFWGAPGWDYEAFALTADDVRQLGRLPRFLVLQGEADDVVAADHPGRYQALIPHAEIRRLAGIDHEAGTAGPLVAAAIAELDTGEA